MDDLTDLGPAAPAWCESEPSWDSLDPGTGATILTWTRDIGSVWITCYDDLTDGELVRSEASIGYCGPPAQGLDAAGARRLAAELLAAADLLEK
jgi:hypothetical protein